MTSGRKATILLLALAVLNLAVLAGGHLLSLRVVPGWKKGPLIDPAAPYSPENAVVIFAWAACAMFDVYVLLLWASRRLGSGRAWAPLAAMLVAVAVGEAGIRAWLAQNQITYFRPHPTLHWQVRPNLVEFLNVSGGGYLNTNADGMRNVTTPRTKPEGAYRVLILGDSSNFGHGVDSKEVGSWQLEQLLADKLPGRKIEVLNGACPGWTTYQAVEFMRTIGRTYAPDLVVAGFNNDPGPEYFGDKGRTLSGPVRAVNGLLWRFESYLVAREMVLSTARRFVPAPDIHYTARTAGAAPNYGKLQEDEAVGLVPRVPLEEFLANVKALWSDGKADGYAFAWINMPINRAEPELVERYVNYEYRTSLARLADELDFPIFDVDARWLRTREPELHIIGHVHHPSAVGHLRLAEQVAQELLSAGLLPGAKGDVQIGGWPPATTADTLRLAISTFTPVHAHVAAVLAAHPELPAKHGLTVEAVPYRSGGPQGEDVARGAIDAFFTCEVPAVQMLNSRTDVRIVASPGVLGRVAVVARAGAVKRLSDLRGKRVGYAAGSTTEMDWATWGKDLGAVGVPMKTEALERALAGSDVAAIVAWDPWVESILQAAPGQRVVLAEREFRSDLAVSVPWSQGGAGRARQLVAMTAEALQIAASDRPRWDAAVVELSGWSLPVVRAVADQNAILSGRAAGSGALALTEVDTRNLARALAFVHLPELHIDTVLDPALLEGKLTTVRYSATAQFNNKPRAPFTNSSPAGVSVSPAGVPAAPQANQGPPKPPHPAMPKGGDGPRGPPDKGGNGPPAPSGAPAQGPAEKGGDGRANPSGPPPP